SRDSVKDTTYTPGEHSFGFDPHLTTPCRRKPRAANVSAIVVGIAFRPQCWRFRCQFMLQIISNSSSCEKLIKARVQLLFSHPFFASLCLRLNFVAAPVK